MLKYLNENYMWQSNSRTNLLNLLLVLKPDELFVMKYSDGYVLYVRTLERIWDPIKEFFSYEDNVPTIMNLENFYQNYYGLYSNKSFENLEDPELNLDLTLSFGKTFEEMNLKIYYV